MRHGTTWQSITTWYADTSNAWCCIGTTSMSADAQVFKWMWCGCKLQTKSREEFAAKQARQAGDGSHRTWAEFNHINKQAVHNCTDAAERYGPYPP